MSRAQPSPSQISTSKPCSSTKAIAPIVYAPPARVVDFACPTPRLRSQEVLPLVLVTFSARRGNAMLQEAPIRVITTLTKDRMGVFSGVEAVRNGLTRKQLHALCRDGFAVRALPD